MWSGTQNLDDEETTVFHSCACDAYKSMGCLGRTRVVLFLVCVSKVILNRDSSVHLYFIVRGDILGFV